MICVEALARQVFFWNSKGRNIKVPAEMKYKDYKAVYLDKSLTLESWQKQRDGDKIVRG